MCRTAHQSAPDVCFFFSSRRRHTRFKCDWSSDVCSSDLKNTTETRQTQRGDDQGAQSRVEMATNPGVVRVPRRRLGWLVPKPPIPEQCGEQSEFGSISKRPCACPSRNSRRNCHPNKTKSYALRP